MFQMRIREILLIRQTLNVILTIYMEYFSKIVALLYEVSCHYSDVKNIVNTVGFHIIICSTYFLKQRPNI